MYKMLANDIKPRIFNVQIYIEMVVHDFGTVGEEKNNINKEMKKSDEREERCQNCFTSKIFLPMLLSEFGDKIVTSYRRYSREAFSSAAVVFHIDDDDGGGGGFAAIFFHYESNFQY